MLQEILTLLYPPQRKFNSHLKGVQNPHEKGLIKRKV